MRATIIRNPAGNLEPTPMIQIQEANFQISSKFLISFEIEGILECQFSYSQTTESKINPRAPGYYITGASLASWMQLPELIVKNPSEVSLLT